MRRFSGRAAVRLAVLLAACLAPGAARAIPSLDGERDAEYALVSASAVDNLRAGDASDPRARSLDAGSLWAANTAMDLYVYVDLPYLDLNIIAGEWCLLFHLKGANDGIARTGSFGDPYGASVDFTHSPAANAVLKSNMRGYLADFDGNQGWAFLNPVNSARTDWAWSNSNFLGDAGWQKDTANGTILGSGRSGAGIVYRAGRGLEMRIPLFLFAGNGNTSVTAPRMGDTLLMQFYDNVRERTSPLYPRGPIDCIPFEAASRTSASRGTVSQWAAYTLSDFSVSGASLLDATDTGHLAVTFSSPAGIGATTPANYTVLNETTGLPVPVASAMIDPNDAKRVFLTLPLPFNARLRVTVQGVKGADGMALSGATTAAVRIPPGLIFNLRDPYGAIAALGNDPNTGQPYRLTVTGDPIAWRTGATEIPLVKVPGDTIHYRSSPVFAGPDIVNYKFRVPGLPGSDNWNALNPKDRRWLVLPDATLVESSDNAAGTVAGTAHYGTNRTSFALVDLDDMARGRPVYLTGDFNGWGSSPTNAVAMLPVSGEPNTYRAEFDMPAGFGAGVATRYKYIIVPDAGNPGRTLWNDLNPLGDRWALLTASGAPPIVRVHDAVGGPRFSRIMRVVAGLDAVPGWSDYFMDLDLNEDGALTLRDAMEVSRPVRMPRLRAEGTRIVDASGAEVLLRGTNLGGWLVEEMWMTPWVTDPPSGSSYEKVQDHVSLWRTLEQRLGTESAWRVRTEYRNAWLQEQDFGRIRAAGFEHVRLPFLYSLLEEAGGMDWLRRAVRDANRAGLYVILDMHGAPGGQNPWDHSGEVGRNEFFTDPANVALAAQVWTEIAREFANQPGVAAFNLMNEPAGAPDPTTLHRAHNTMYQAIRQVAPDTMIVIEDGYKGFDTMPALSQYGWTNVVYSTHIYNFGATSTQDHLNGLNSQLPGLLATRNARGVPLYIGEFNLEPHNSPDAMRAFTGALTGSGCSWTIWTYKTVAKNGPMGYWGYWSYPTAVDALNPFTDSEADLIAKLRQVRTENLTIPAGLAGVFKDR